MLWLASAAIGCGDSTPCDLSSARVSVVITGGQTSFASIETTGPCEVPGIEDTCAPDPATCSGASCPCAVVVYITGSSPTCHITVSSPAGATFEVDVPVASVGDERCLVLTPADSQQSTIVVDFDHSP